MRAKENTAASKAGGCIPFGASDEARTRYLHLGKVALYQMSYTRGKWYYSRIGAKVKSHLRNLEKVF